MSKQNSNNKSFSIQTKVNLSLIGVFVLVFAVSLTAIYRSESHLALDVAEQTTVDSADSYFDSINILMLSGAMQNRETLQQKILSNEHITEARIIRGKPVADMYGPGLADAVIRDELDERAMAGEQIIKEIDDEQGHRLTVVTPMYASSSYKGTNCLMCHPVEEGSVLGAVRVTYSFEALDRKIANNIISVAGVELALFTLGVIVISLLLRRLVVRPVNEMNDTIQLIERDNNLNLRVEVNSNDEVGQMGRAFNSMLDNFHASLKHVSDTIHQLSQSSQEINSIADSSNDAVHQQQVQTSSVASAMEQMEAATRSVEGSAESTVSASDLALQESRDGRAITEESLRAIEVLKQNIEQATTVIEKLDSQSQNVGTVLEVIQKIAEQTNLLALNAAIEAARAGEQGRGFAVVADEVRTLASRTHNSTEEIDQIIEQLQRDAKDAVSVMNQALTSAETSVEQVQKTSGALTNIAEEVRVINDMNHQVASAVREQTQMASSVEASVTEISRGAEETAERTQLLSQVSHQLNGLAQQLDEMVRRFKL